MNFDPNEAMHVVVHLHGAEESLKAFIIGAGPVVEAICWMLFQCCGLLAGGRIIGAIIRAMGR